MLTQKHSGKADQTKVSPTVGRWRRAFLTGHNSVFFDAYPFNKTMVHNFVAVFPLTHIADFGMIPQWYAFG